MGVCFSNEKYKRAIKDEKTKLCNQILSVAQLETLYRTENNQTNRFVSSEYIAVPRRSSISRMAASLPTMSIVKTLVSKNRIRLREGGFDLDLTYITEKIIAMGYPASNIEGVYRNHIDDVYDFLEQKHKDHYQIYNLCSERSYDKSKFRNRVKVYPFDDHNPPCIEMIEPFCRDVDEWIASHPENVAAVHCKAGKGRTGTMICCYLLHSREFNTADQALTYYGQMRTQDQKGVTIPSQVRYVKYYATYIRDNLKYTPTAVYLKELQLVPAPTFTSGPYAISYSVSYQNVKDVGDQKSQECVKVHKSLPVEFRKGHHLLVADVAYCNTLRGDLKIEIFHKSKLGVKKKLMQVWFNTFFVNIDPDAVPSGTCDKTVSFKKHELDILNKKDRQHKMFAKNFELRVTVQVIPTCKPVTMPEMPKLETATHSESSEGESTEEDDDWDSGECKLDKGPGRESKRSGLKKSKSGRSLSSKGSDKQPKLEQLSIAPKAGSSKSKNPPLPGSSKSP